MYTLNFFKGDDLELKLAAIPQNITEFALNNNDACLKGYELIKILKASPKNVKTINLSRSSLGGYDDGRRLHSTDDLIAILKALPTHLIVLDLSSNYLNWLSADEFVDVIQALPVGLKSLGLRSNNLDKYSASDLIKILKALPQNLASLNLNYNKLGEKFSAIELIEILQALPQNLTSLCFEGNQLGNFSHQEKIQILTSLPKNLNHLNLNNNFFMHLTGNELSEIFEVLPKNLASLAWCENLLYRFSAYELDTAFSKLSANNLTSLFLSANKLKDNQVNALLDFLAHSKITTLELKTTWMETQENSYQGGLSEKTSNEIEMILRNNQNKALLNADPDGSGIYGLQALCGRAITLFQVPCGIENTPLSCLRIIDESKQMVETQGIKLGKY